MRSRSSPAKQGKKTSCHLTSKKNILAISSNTLNCKNCYFLAKKLMNVSTNCNLKFSCLLVLPDKFNFRILVLQRVSLYPLTNSGKSGPCCVTELFL